MSTHPGVLLTQKANGGTWNVRFRDPRDKNKLVLRSTETKIYDVAKQIAEEFARLVKNPDQWDAPPKELHPRTLKIWGANSDETSAEEALKALDDPTLLTSQPKSSNSKYVDWDGKEQNLAALKKEIERLLGRIVVIEQERQAWKNRAQIAEGKLERMGHKILREKSAQNITLEQALDAFKTKMVGKDSNYTENVKWDAERFVEKFGKKTMLVDMTGREDEIDAWLQSLVIEEGKRKGQPIGAGRRQEVRRVALKMLSDSGLDVRRKDVKRPTKKDVRNDRGPKRWLSKRQARAVSKVLPQPWQDYFRVQLGLGLRPDELITLKRADFDEKVTTLTLSELEHLTLKEGSRTMKVPTKVKSIIARRLKSSNIIFPDDAGNPWPDAKMFDRRYLVALKAAGKAANIPFEMDCRVPRRTCTTILLEAGVPVKAVSDILGDDPATILEHYAGVMEGSLDPSAAAI